MATDFGNVGGVYNEENKDMIFASATIGLNKEAMETYKNELRTECFEKVAAVIKGTDQNNYPKQIADSINTNWQGKSRDLFLRDFTKANNDLLVQLAKEYDDLISKLNELQQYYIDADKMLYNGMGEDI